MLLYLAINGKADLKTLKSWDKQPTVPEFYLQTIFVFCYRRITDNVTKAKLIG